MIPTILWQGDRIRCMKTSRTMQCKICMVERTEILSRFRSNRSKIMNDNDDIFSPCKCRSRFHKFARNITPTLRTRMTQKKPTSTRHSKQKRNKRFSFSPRSSSRLFPRVSPTQSPPSSPESTASSLAASTPPPTPQFLIDTNLPCLPYRTPTANPTNLELDQVRTFRALNPSFEV